MEQNAAQLKQQNYSMDDAKKEDKKTIFEQSFGILSSGSIDPIKWQNMIREENNSSLYKEMNN